MKMKLPIADFARFTDDIPECVDVDKEAYQELAATRSRRQYTVGNSVADVAVDWTGYFQARKRRRANSSIDVEVKGLRGDAAFDLLWVYFSEIFLIINLAAPGAMSYLKVSPSSPSRRETLFLDGYVFDRAWSDSKLGIAPTISPLSFGDVAIWYDSLRIGVKQLASSRVETALFSLLHACHLSTTIEPAEALWLALGLESLYQVPTALSFSVLSYRVASLFQLDAPTTSDLKKRLRIFFDVRNAFAHGGASILHPVGSAELDSDVEALRGDLIEPSFAGFHVLTATLQQFVRHRWVDMQFHETCSGVTPKAG
jgi:hypothetical protein